MSQDPPRGREVKLPALKPDDFYFDGPNMVFTAVYHLKRGTCCESGCRHCPFKSKEAEQGLK